MKRNGSYERKQYLELLRLKSAQAAALHAALADNHGLGDAAER